MLHGITGQTRVALGGNLKPGLAATRGGAISDAARTE
jgi:hypothetical protein